MSNAKWRKLFTWLTERNNKISSYKIKLLLAEANVLWETRVLRVSDLEETHLADKDLYPIGYDEIEWVDVVTPHSDQLLTGIVKLGKFEIQAADFGFRVYGYSKTGDNNSG